MQDKDVQDIKKSLARLEVGIFGDKKAGISGMVSRVEALEQYKEKDQKLKYKVAGGVAVGTPILIGFWDACKEWLHKIF